MYIAAIDQATTSTRCIIFNHLARDSRQESLSYENVAELALFRRCSVFHAQSLIKDVHAIRAT